jgi:hypothetical protein
MNYCKSIIKTGKNSGKVCNRLSCKIKGHTNLAVYMNMPEFYIAVYNNNKKKFDDIKYIDMYKKDSKIDKKEYIKDCMKFFDQFEKFERSHEKEFLFILMLKLFDTPNFNKLIHRCQRFKKILYEKITKNEIRGSEFLVEYLKKIELNKKYLHIELNKSHRKKVVKKYIRSTMIFYGLYRIVIEKRYRPGGIGYHECEDRFYKNCKELEKLKH